MKVNMTEVETMKDVSLIGSYLFDGMSGVWAHIFLVRNNDILLDLLKYSNLKCLKIEEDSGFSVIEIIDY